VFLECDSLQVPICRGICCLYHQQKALMIHTIKFVKNVTDIYFLFGKGTGIGKVARI
jgi:hypothetical protein